MELRNCIEVEAGVVHLGVGSTDRTAMARGGGSTGV
jgi:hypothetical protein